MICGGPGLSSRCTTEIQYIHGIYDIKLEGFVIALITAPCLKWSPRYSYQNSQYNSCFFMFALIRHTPLVLEVLVPNTLLTRPPSPHSPTPSPCLWPPWGSLGHPGASPHPPASSHLSLLLVHKSIINRNIQMIMYRMCKMCVDMFLITLKNVCMWSSDLIVVCVGLLVFALFILGWFMNVCIHFEPLLCHHVLGVWRISPFSLSSYSVCCKS